MNEADLRARLDPVPVPDLDRALGELQYVLEAGDDAEPRLVLPFPAAGIRDALESAAAAAIGGPIGIAWRIPARGARGAIKPLPGVRNLVAVASGKGGVGKSTTAVNLALALAAEGARAGVLDADIYGPSQPMMLGLEGSQPVSRDGKTFEPLEAHGLQAISVGFLVDAGRPVIWRGPMVTQALNQLMFQTNWRDLDYLVVDLPPGTGDTQLTLTQKAPVAGAVIVTTPQDIALLDARKGLAMFRRVGVPVLGIVENMSSFVCPGCGEETALFGSDGGARLAGEAEVPLLGRLPLDIAIRREADGGCPTVAADPEGELAQRYRSIARRAAAAL